MKFQREELEKMKRAELQKLCKSYGIKANMKTAKLIEGLLQYSTKENSTDSTDSDQKYIPEIDTIGSSESKVLEKEVECKNDDKVQTRSDKIQETQEEKINIVPAVIVKEKAPLSKVGSSKIPRLTNELKSNKKVGGSSTPKNNQSKTPKHSTAPKDWSKIHQKQFDKMDSLGDYLEKKRKRAAGLTGSVKKVKLCQDDHSSTTKKAATLKTTSKSSSPKTPKLQQVDPVGRKKRLTFHYSNSKAAMKENMFTPGKMKRRATLGATKTPTQAPQQKHVTPFRFTANTTETLFSPTPRKAFDLKASLAKPLTYKPHTGRLASLTVKQVDLCKSSSMKNKTHERDVKAVKVTTRKERRNERMKKQSKKRVDAICKRRGVLS